MRAQTKRHGADHNICAARIPNTLDRPGPPAPPCNPQDWSSPCQIPLSVRFGVRGQFPPIGWALCQGQLMPISEMTPCSCCSHHLWRRRPGDFRSSRSARRVPKHQGQGSGLSNYVLASRGASRSVTLTTGQIPAHNHLAVTTTTGQQAAPTNAILASASSTQAGVRIYSSNAAKW